MYLPGRIRHFREAKHLSQGDIEKRTGLLRCYISRVENGHTTPSLETLEKLARALEMPLYQMFYDGDEVVTDETISRDAFKDWASHGSGVRKFRQLRNSLSRMKESDRTLLIEMAGVIQRKKKKKAVLAKSML
jgi:transcriptional regulator with XRE-family HTH domain